jgi:hypothetical protein
MSSLRVTSLRGRSNGVSPTLPDGGVVTGVLTATSFSGNGSGLIGVASTDNIITGTAATFTAGVNISGLTTVGVMTVTNALNVTGIVTATSFEGSGANLTGLPEGTNILKAMLFV